MCHNSLRSTAARVLRVHRLSCDTALGDLQCNDHDAGEHCSHTDHSARPRDGRTIAVAVSRRN